MFAHLSTKDLNTAWLSQCTPQTVLSPTTPHIHRLPDHVVKLRRDERDDNEVAAIDLVRKHVPSLPTPRLIDRCPGLNVFEYIEGECAAAIWPQLSTAQKTALVKQVRAWIVELAQKVPAPAGAGVRSLTKDGKIAIRGCDELKGPWKGAKEFAVDTGLDCGSKTPVFAHGSWSLENIFLSAQDRGKVVAVVSWEGAGFFPDAGRCLQAEGSTDKLWRGLFEGLQIPET